MQLTDGLREGPSAVWTPLAAGACALSVSHFAAFTSLRCQRLSHTVSVLCDAGPDRELLIFVACAGVV